jgi:hypothetical protein
VGSGGDLDLADAHFEIRKRQLPPAHEQSGNRSRYGDSNSSAIF